MMLRLVVFLLFLSASAAFAQSNVLLNYKDGSSPPANIQVSPANPLPVNPSGGTLTTTETKVTVAVTNTYQQALASSGARKGCTLQYIAVAGTKGYVFFGSAPGDTTTSFQLTNGQTVNCQTPSGVLTDAVQVTGTGTDIFVVSNQ